MTHFEIFYKIQHLIRTPYVESVKAYINELTGYTVNGPGERGGTLEIRPMTLNIISNDEGTIIWFNFG